MSSPPFRGIRGQELPPKEGKPPAECDSAKNILTERVEKSKVDKRMKTVYTKSIKRRCQQTVCPPGRIKKNNRYIWRMGRLFLFVLKQSKNADNYHAKGKEPFVCNHKHHPLSKGE